MHSTGIAGCLLLLYTPFAVASAAALIVHPQLLIVALIGAVFALISLFMTSLCYVLLQQWAFSAFFVVLHVVVVGVLRVLLLHLLYRADCFARGQGQVLVASRARFALVGVAAGCGFGAVSALRGAGTLLDATQRLTFYTKGTAVYDLHVCTRLPLLLHSTIQAFLLLMCQVAWAVMTGQALVALQLLKPEVTWRLCDRYHSLLSRNADNATEEAEPHHDTQYVQLKDSPLPQQSDSGTVGRPSPDLHVIQKSVSSPSPEQQQQCSMVLQIKEEVEYPLLCVHKFENWVEVGAESMNSTCETAENVTEGREGESVPNNNLPQAEEEEPLLEIHAATLLCNNSRAVVLALFCAPPLLHLIFSLVSLLNSGAYNDELLEEVPLRGCIVTLPLQVVVAVLSLWITVIVFFHELNGHAE